MLRKNPWLTFSSAALYFFYVVLQMSIFNTLSSSLIHTFNLSPTQLGSLSSSYFYADALFLFPSGILLDKFSNKIQLLVTMLCCFISVAIFGLANQYNVLVAMHAVSGVANAFAFLGCMRLIALWFPSHRHALVVGLMMTVGLLGGVVAQAPVVFLLSILDWRTIMLINAFIGLLIWITMFVFIVDKEANTSECKQKISIHDFFCVLKKHQNWLFGLYTTFLNLPAIIFGFLWGNLYLTQAHLLSSSQASLVVSMIFIGVIIGSPIIGAWSDFAYKRKPFMIAGSILSLILILIVINSTHLTWQTLVILFFLLGIFSSTQIISYTSVAETNPKKLSGTVISIVSVLLNCLTAIIQPFFGWLISINNSTLLKTTSSIYSPHSYRIALIIMPIAYALSLAISLIIKEPYASQAESANY